MSLLSTFSEWSWLGALLLPLLGAATGGGGDASDSGGAPARPHNPDWDEDHQLVRAVLDGDSTAYRGLVERYQGRIYSVCYGMARNREDARDLAQEAFVKAFKNLSRFRFGASFYTWLCRIAMNVSIDHLRRQKVRRADVFDEAIASRSADGVISLQHHRHDPGKDLERKRLHAAILAAMDELPEEQKQVVVLREVEGMAYKEIAEVMDIPEGTVMSRLYYARKKLQKALKGERK
jgi:RNA polymerase sigma-70 factor, ECF subfamily